MLRLLRHSIFVALIAPVSLLTLTSQVIFSKSLMAESYDNDNAKYGILFYYGKTQALYNKTSVALNVGARNALTLGVNSKIQKIQGTISISPDAVETGTSTTVTIVASGFFDLSAVRASQISIRPDQGISNIVIVWATAQQLKLSFNVAEDAAIGPRALLIKNNGGATVVALDLGFNLGSHICQPPCVSPQRCRNNVCVGCRPPCKDDQVCRGNFCVNRPPPICIPPCSGIGVCIDGRCEVQK